MNKKAGEQYWTTSEDDQTIWTRVRSKGVYQFIPRKARYNLAQVQKELEFVSSGKRLN